MHYIGGISYPCAESGNLRIVRDGKVVVERDAKRRYTDGQAQADEQLLLHLVVRAPIETKDEDMSVLPFVRVWVRA